MLQITRLALGTALVLALLFPAAAPLADDTAFFSSRVAPNVVLFIDESGSMRNIIQHPYFSADAAPYIMSDGTECDALPLSQGGTNNYLDENSPQRGIKVVTGGSTGHRFEPRRSELGDWTEVDAAEDPDQGYVERRFCGHDRKIYTDKFLDTYTRTLWPRLYINWYFHLEPNEVYDHPDPNISESKTGQKILEEIEDLASGKDYITGDPFPRFQVARISAAKQVAKEVMYRINSDCPPYLNDCGVYEDRVRFGIAEFRGNDGGYVSEAPVDYPNGKADLDSTINGLRTGGQTPLAETLFQLYTFFMERGDGVNRPVGVDGTEFPSYDYTDDGSYTNSTDFVPDPIVANCQKQFVIMITDGAPTRDQFETNGNVTQGFGDFLTMIGDYAPDETTENDWDQSAPEWSVTQRGKEEGNAVWPQSHSAGYLDDVAKFMRDTDLRDDIPEKQIVEVYTVGFTTIGPVNTLLAKTARNAGGQFFEARESDELANALVTALRSIVAKSQVFTAATVPASRASDGNNFYATYFEPSNSSPFWKGHLKLFEFNRAGEIRDAPVGNATQGECAVDDPNAPARCRVGRLKLELPGFWDATNGIPAPGSRNLFVSKLDGNGDPDMVSFDTGLDAADLGLSAPPNTSAYASAGHDTAGISDVEELSDAIVRYAQGCEFRDGSCIDRGDGRKLWDIFHSDPISVGSPNRGLRDSSYKEFVQRYRHRKRIVYAGSNGGFLHAFDSGEYGTLALPEAYTRGDGSEEFGFMPYPTRQTIAELPLNVPRTRYFVDGPPSVGDVFIDPSADVDDVASWHEWRTVLIAGMRQGGRVVYALDVTDPPDHNSANGESNDNPVAIAYPEYLWEFPCEASACDTYRSYMGETWSKPVITRIRATTDCDAGDTGCDVEDRWVAIFGAGYDPRADPNLAHATDGSSDRYDARTEAAPAGRAIFMVDVSNGEVFGVRHFQHDGTSGDSSDGEPEMKYAFAGNPAVFDVDRDGYADVVYMGDLGGNLWKWVIDEPVRDPNRGSVPGDAVQEDWDFLRFFAAENCTGCSPKHYKSFFSAPTGALVGANLWLAFGSGERNDLDFGQAGGPDVPLATAEKNRFYVMKDTDPLELERDPANLPLTTANDLTNVTNISQTNPATCLAGLGALGFYIEGAEGEKFVTATTIFFGTVLTGSFIPPAATANQCNSSGEGFLYGFGLFCGEGMFPDPNNAGSTLRSVSVGIGMPADPRVSVGAPRSGGGGGGGGGCEDMVVVLTSEGQAFSDCPGGRPDSGISLKSWRN